jgi:hypothetical protein
LFASEALSLDTMAAAVAVRQRGDVGSAMLLTAVGREAAMKRRVSAAPAWAIVLVFGVVASFIRVAFGRPEESAVATVLLVVLLLALAGALVVRGGRDGWGIYGVMLAVSYGLQGVDWSLGVEVFIYVCVATSVVWLLFDLRANRAPPAAERVINRRPR